MKSQRWQIFAVGLGIWALLAFWSISVFWAHIDQFADSNFKKGMYVGATASEFVVLVMLFWHCFNIHIGVRRVCIFLGLFLTFAIVIHSAALRGKSDALHEQAIAGQQLAGNLALLSGEQLRQAKEANDTALKNPNLSRRERNRLQKEGQALAAQITGDAQKNLTQASQEMATKAEEDSMFPPWYLHGWCYAVLFCLAVICVFIPSLMMLNQEDIDRDFDGIPDHQQGGASRRVGFTPPGPKDAPLPSAAKAGAQDQ